LPVIIESGPSVEEDVIWDFPSAPHGPARRTPPVAMPPGTKVRFRSIVGTVVETRNDGGVRLVEVKLDTPSVQGAYGMVVDANQLEFV